ncbi:metalloregulator ArsR/SmtB family transcription factor [Amphibacillus sp. MSJ-3]|uniref:ArsR/SmtB family transcription factor n=1 Tax=Amphibacillus sp. MSJ-3 TaxID=2841505 RepID=UPI001C0EA41A|nr:metalloregulator ArsR/SmtB family transcription factor [Amphibacillus sp. MSJ-3]MBU5595238.1 metalloregulator ArsR/SmtB family transcription factor [Amphibacillus sp. MSJ-3]
MNEHTNLPLNTCEVFSFDEEKVNRAKVAIDSEDFIPVVAMFKVLSSQTRLKIIYALIEESELCVCDVANIIDSTTATASHHLRQLHHNGLAKVRKEGKRVFYSLDDNHVKKLMTIAIEHGKEVAYREE